MAQVDRHVFVYVDETGDRGAPTKAALWPGGEFNYVEPAYLSGVWRQLRNSDSCAIPVDIMSTPEYSLLTRVEWFPCRQCTE